MRIDLKEMGKRLKEIRGGLSLVEFEKIAGISKNMLSLYERGEAWPKPEFLNNIIEYGKVSLEWLLTGEELQKKPVEYPLAEDEKRAINTAEDLLKYKGLDKRFAVVEIHHPPPGEERLNDDEKKLLEVYRTVDGAGKALILSVAENTATAFKQKAGGSGGVDGLRDVS